MADKVRITSENINKYANAFCAALLDLEPNEYIHPKELGEKIGLNESQVRNMARYIRRCSLNRDYETYINYYIISGPSGYALLKKTTLEEQEKCFKTLYLHSQSIQTTLIPLERSLRANNIDVDSLLNGYSNDDDGCEYYEDQMNEFVDHVSKLNREGADFWNYDN